MDVIQLSKNFTISELSCKCGCKMVPTSEFVTRLQNLRDAYGKPMTVTSAARCAKYNESIGGAKESKHILGIAADIACTNGAERYRLIRLAQMFGFAGIGLHKDFLHLDIRPMSEAVSWFY